MEGSGAEPAQQRLILDRPAALRAGGGKGEELGFANFNFHCGKRVWWELHQNRELQCAHCTLGTARSTLLEEPGKG